MTMNDDFFRDPIGPPLGRQLFERSAGDPFGLAHADTTTKLALASVACDELKAEAERSTRVDADQLDSTLDLLRGVVGEQAATLRAELQLLKRLCGAHRAPAHTSSGYAAQIPVLQGGDQQPDYDTVINLDDYRVAI